MHCEYVLAFAFAGTYACEYVIVIHLAFAFAYADAFASTYVSAFAGTYASIFAITYALALACNISNFERLVKWS